MLRDRSPVRMGDFVVYDRVQVDRVRLAYAFRATPFEPAVELEVHDGSDVVVSERRALPIAALSGQVLAPAERGPLWVALMSAPVVDLDSRVALGLALAAAVLVAPGRPPLTRLRVDPRLTRVSWSGRLLLLHPRPAGGQGHFERERERRAAWFPHAREALVATLAGALLVEPDPLRALARLGTLLAQPSETYAHALLLELLDNLHRGLPSSALLRDLRAADPRGPGVARAIATEMPGAHEDDVRWDAARARLTPAALADIPRDVPFAFALPATLAVVRAGTALVALQRRFDAQIDWRLGNALPVAGDGPILAAVAVPREATWAIDLATSLHTGHGEPFAAIAQPTDAAPFHVFVRARAPHAIAPTHTPDAHAAVALAAARAVSFTPCLLVEPSLHILTASADGVVYADGLEVDVPAARGVRARAETAIAWRRQWAALLIALARDGIAAAELRRTAVEAEAARAGAHVAMTALPGLSPDFSRRLGEVVDALVSGAPWAQTKAQIRRAAEPNLRVDVLFNAHAAYSDAALRAQRPLLLSMAADDENDRERGRAHAEERNTRTPAQRVWDELTAQLVNVRDELPYVKGGMQALAEDAAALRQRLADVVARRRSH